MEQWNLLKAKIAESEQVQAQIAQLHDTLVQLHRDITELATTLEQEVSAQS